MPCAIAVLPVPGCPAIRIARPAIFPSLIICVGRYVRVNEFDTQQSTGGARFNIDTVVVSTARDIDAAWVGSEAYLENDTGRATCTLLPYHPL